MTVYMLHVTVHITVTNIFFFPQLLEDPIFIPISQLEMHLGKPAEFLELQKQMLAGEIGMLKFPKARDGKARVRRMVRWFGCGVFPSMLVGCWVVCS